MTQRLLIVDNFDSFTYNLLHYCEVFPGIYCEVKRNDEVDAHYASNFDSILFSPGPGLPKDAGNMNAVLAAHYADKKILGVCLGMQAIGEFFGAKLINGEFPMHGRISELTITNGSVLFKNLPKQLKIGRYHSWMIDEKTLPNELIPTAYAAKDGSLQALKHKKYNIEAVQFHPESVLTECGKQMVENWLSC